MKGENEIELILLADDPLAYKQVARWHFDYTNRDKAPLLVLAKLEGELVGFAELKIREMDIFPNYEY